MDCSLNEVPLRNMTTGQRLEPKYGVGTIPYHTSRRHVLCGFLGMATERIFADTGQSESFTLAAEAFAKAFDISWDLSVHGSEGQSNQVTLYFNFRI